LLDKKAEHDDYNIKENKMKKLECTVCGYIYDEEAEGKLFADLPDDYECPICGAGKDMFEEVK